MDGKGRSKNKQWVLWEWIGHLQMVATRGSRRDVLFFTQEKWGHHQMRLKDAESDIQNPQSGPQ